MEQDSSRALFKPAKTQRASEAIYNQIYPKIVSGELQPGDRLPPERELAEMFQRSRPVVREALRMLQQDGLLDISLGSAGGAVVRGVSLKSVEEPLENLVAMGAINLDESTTGAAPVWRPSTTRRRTPRPCGRRWRARRPVWMCPSASRNMTWPSTPPWPRPATTRWPF